MSEELWNPVHDWPEYWVSNLGRVMRFKAAAGATVGAILKPWKTRYGYLAVSLRRPGVRKAARVHRLVARAFCGPQPPNMPDVAHWDGDVTNNSAVNLRWATKSSNMLDMTRHGRQHGGAYGSRTFNAEEVDAIQKRAAAGESIEAIRKSLGVSWDAVKTAVRSGAKSAR